MLNKWKQHACVLLTLIVSSAILTGCWDRREINDVAFVLGSAIDITESGEYQVSALIPLPGNMGGAMGGAGDAKPFTIKTAYGKDIRGAVDNLQKSLPRWLFFGHRRVLIVSDKLVETIGFKPVVDAITRTPENRLTAFIAVSKGPAIDVLNADIRMERFSAESIREMLQSDASLRISLKEITAKMIAVGDDAMFPYLNKRKTTLKGHESEDIQVIGFALTHDGVMKASASDGAANGVRLLNAQFRPYRETLEDGESTITIAANSNQLKIKPSMRNGVPYFEISSLIKISINEDTNYDRDYDDIGQRSHIEKLFVKKAKSDINAALALMKQSKSDVIGFGRYLSRSQPGKWDKEWKGKWEELFPQSEFIVTVKAEVFRIGMNRENLAKKDQRYE
ncbi:Ger(x)C family spore germination protein [Paenibacillus sp. NEAU-GSW1]|nr:Ger(x)C family spore germination protein [Paenibacillus sp. NEAU-GSW1]